MTDRALVTRYAADRDEAAFAALVRRHGRLVWAACRRALRDEGDAEDAFQATFLTLARHAGRIRDGESVAGWLYRVAGRVAVKAAKTAARRAPREPVTPETVPAPAAPCGLAWRELQAALQLEVGRLPAGPRDAFVLCCLEQLTKAEAARRLGWPEGTVSSRLAEARRLLRGRLARRGIDLGAVLAALAVAPAAAMPPGLAATAVMTAVSSDAGGPVPAGVLQLVTGVGPMKLFHLPFTRPLVVTAALSVAGLGLVLGAAAVVGVTGAPPEAVGLPGGPRIGDGPPPPGPGPAGADRTGPAAVGRARQHEAWFADVKSFHVRLEATTKRTPEQLERAKERLAQEGKPPPHDAKKYPETLLPEVRHEVELAFDGRRVRDWVKMGDYFSFLRVWDGEKLVGENRSHGTPAYWVHQSKTDLQQKEFQAGSGSLGFMAWQKTDYRPQWFMPPREADNRILLGGQFGPAEQYEVTGHESYRGVRCVVVERKTGLVERWYVGEATGLLHGLQAHPLHTPEVDRIAQEVAAKFGGRIKGFAYFLEFCHNLPAAQREQAETEFVRRARGVAKPSVEYWCLDYKEVTPGRFFPMRQGVVYSELKGGEPRVREERAWRVTTLAVDEPLPDDLFRVDMKDGATVQDRRFGDIIEYKYRPDVTREELEALAAEKAEERKQRDAQKQARDALILGKPAVPFAEGATWVNSEPLTWDGLKGKVVVLDFWAVWCAPCRNDQPIMKNFHGRREQTGIVVVGVHAAHEKEAEVGEYAKKQGLPYPIYVDRRGEAAGKGEPPWGEVFARYGVKQMPESVVIDRDGRIAGYGRLTETLLKARELAARKPAGEPGPR